jgi:hypothetical protein
MTKRKASRRRVKSQTEFDEDTMLKIVALELLVAALDPSADATDQFINTVLKMIDVTEVDGRRFVSLSQLQFVLAGGLQKMREMLPEQPAEIERAIDAGFDEIGDRVDELTAPKSSH